ncbi:MAG: M14 family metallopeptidase [Myxococcota bacterium]
MKRRTDLLPGYLDLAGLVHSWEQVAQRGRADMLVAGHSVEGRPIPAYGFGPRTGVPIFLTALMHGDELIGGLALLHALRRLVDEGRAILDETRLVVMPIVNPDGVRRTFSRMRAGRAIGWRKNARGVDLNRNFEVVTRGMFRHPFSGSRRPSSLHYMGPSAMSEPETRAVARVARRVKPSLALAFHSFGNLLLYPWAFTRTPSRYRDEYRRLGRGFVSCQDRPYRMVQSCGLYPTLGDLDDWLEDRLHVRAMTVEVSRPERSLFTSFAFLHPIRWMNPSNISGALENVAPGIVALLHAALA